MICSGWSENMDYLISKIKGLHISSGGGSSGNASSGSANNSPIIENNVKLSQLFVQENVSDHENVSPQEITLPPQLIFQTQTPEINVNEVGFFFSTQIIH